MRSEGVLWESLNDNTGAVETDTVHNGKLTEEAMVEVLRNVNRALSVVVMARGIRGPSSGLAAGTKMWANRLDTAIA